MKDDGIVRMTWLTATGFHGTYRARLHEGEQWGRGTEVGTGL